MLAIAAAVTGLICGRPASAAVFDFSFGPDASGQVVDGTFTTGAASPTDPGYNLVTDMTFFLLFFVPTTSGPTRVGGSAAVRSLATGAAFNPRTDAFINHSGE